MPTESYNRTQHILKRFTAGQGQDYTLIYEPSLVFENDSIDGNRFNGFLTELRVMVQLVSIEEGAIPNPALTASRTDKINLVYEYEWQSPRKVLGLYLGERNNPTKSLVGQVSLVRRDPMYQKGLLKYLTESIAYSFAPNLQLYARIENAGYGFLSSNDVITIFGAAREEWVDVTSGLNEFNSTTQAIFNVNSVATKVLNSNSQRRTALLVNNEVVTDSAQIKDRIIYLNLGTQSDLNSGIPIYPNGGSFEINDRNLFRGEIYAISSLPAQLNVIEGLIS